MLPMILNWTFPNTALHIHRTGNNLECRHITEFFHGLLVRWNGGTSPSCVRRSPTHRTISKSTRPVDVMGWFSNSPACFKNECPETHRLSHKTDGEKEVFSTREECRDMKTCKQMQRVSTRCFLEISFLNILRTTGEMRPWILYNSIVWMLHFFLMLFSLCINTPSFLRDPGWRTEG